jgi:hypothetical protein
MSILAPSDFVGRYAITQHPTNATKIQSYIDMIEPSIMNELFGVELLALYVQGIEDEEEIYTKLLNPFFDIFGFNRTAGGPLLLPLNNSVSLCGNIITSEPNHDHLTIAVNQPSEH